MFCLFLISVFYFLLLFIISFTYLLYTQSVVRTLCFAYAEDTGLHIATQAKKYPFLACVCKKGRQCPVLMTLLIVFAWLRNTYCIQISNDLNLRRVPHCVRVLGCFLVLYVVAQTASAPSVERMLYSWLP